jgi:hypothetical protein
MTQPKQEFLDRLKAEFPSEFAIVVHPFTIEEDRSITHFVNILMVPRDRLHDVVWRAWEIAEEIYGDEPTTFLMTTVSPEATAEHFAEQLEATGRECVRIPAKLLSGIIQVRRRPVDSKPAFASGWRQGPAAQGLADGYTKLPTTGWSMHGSSQTKTPRLGHALLAAETVEADDPIQRRYYFAA